MKGALRYVAQEEPDGCAIACLAMISGKSYAEVARDFASNQRINGGLSDYAVMWWLNRYRYWTRRSFDDADLTPLSRSVSFALGLVRPSHFVVLCDGRVLDPARPTPLASYEFSQIIEVLPAPPLRSEPTEYWFGCLTGDCDHETQAECNTWIRRELVEQAKEVARLEHALSALPARTNPTQEK